MTVLMHVVGMVVLGGVAVWGAPWLMVAREKVVALVAKDFKK